MARILRWLFFLLIVRPLVLIILGLNVRHRERLPNRGPALIVANHNSHLDTMVLMSLFPLKSLRHIRPVAAMDYFLESRMMAWFSLNIIGIIPIDREARSRGEDPLTAAHEGLDRGDILVLFPEGTRGAPEEMADFKKGVSHLVEHYDGVPTVPVFLHGLGKVMPKGSHIPVPFFVDVFIGEPIMWTDDRDLYMSTLNDSIADLASEGQFPSWD
jgi:1-acyl-sn-glycerol-3-phosphate acyltransferase